MGAKPSFNLETAKANAIELGERLLNGFGRANVGAETITAEQGRLTLPFDFKAFRHALFNAFHAEYPDSPSIAEHDQVMLMAVAQHNAELNKA